MLRMMPMPADANVHGDVFGGWIMSHVDVAGAIPAARRAGGRVATVAVTSFVFRQAVFVGDLVSFYAEIIEARHDVDHGRRRGLRRAQSSAERSRQSDGGNAGVRGYRRTTQASNAASCYESRGDACAQSG